MSYFCPGRSIIIVVRSARDASKTTCLPLSNPLLLGKLKVACIVQEAKKRAVASMHKGEVGPGSLPTWPDATKWSYRTGLFLTCHEIENRLGRSAAGERSPQRNSRGRMTQIGTDRAPLLAHMTIALLFYTSKLDPRAPSWTESLAIICSCTSRSILG